MGMTDIPLNLYDYSNYKNLLKQRESNTN